MAQSTPATWYRPTYVSKVWDNKNGLPQNTVFDLKKDDRGFLWLATEEGVSCFDGNTFEVFNETNVPGLTSSAFYSIAPALGGGIWAASDYAVVRVNRNKAQAIELKNYIKNSRITCINQDQQGRLWIGTQAGDLLYLQNNTVFSAKAWTYKGKRSVQVLALTREGLLVGTEKGLFQISQDQRSVKAIPGYENQDIRALAVAPDHSIWIGTKEHGVFHQTQNQAVNFTQKDGLGESFITALSLAPDGSLWAGTLTTGVYRLQNGKFTSINPKGMPEDGVRTILFDQPNLVWLGTAASGVVQFKPAEVHMLSAEYQAPDKAILPIYQHPNGDVWFGANGAGVSRISEGKVVTYTSRQGLSADVVLSLAGTRKNIFIGTPNGLNRFNLSTGKIEETYTEQHGLASDIIQALYADQQERLWIATRSGGIHTVGPDGKVKKVQVPPGLAKADFVSIFEDRTQNKWIGSRGAGMVRLSPAGQLTHFYAKQGLPAGIIDCFYQDAEGDLWLGTDKGLVCYTNNRFFLLNKTNGLHFNGIYQILEDGKGYLWLSGSFGLQRISLQELLKAKKSQNRKIQVTARLYDTSDGLANAEMNGGIFPAGYKLQDGTLWFPTVEGVAIVDPATTQLKKGPVNVSILEFRMGNTALDLSQPIVLPPGVNTLEIDYTSIQFAKPSAVNFYYRLKGINNAWEFADQRRTAYFTTLKPGTYTFEVKAELNGVWSQPVQLTFKVKPFFYQSSWFTFLMVLLLFLAGYFLKKFLSKHQQERWLKELVEARTQDLKDSNDRFQLVNKATFLVVWEYDPVRQDVYWGESLESLFGHKPADKAENYNLWFENIHPADSDRILSTFNSSLVGDTLTWNEEYRFRKGDGHYANVVDRGYILRDSQGKAIRMLGAMQDITKVKEEEQRLKLLESVITNATDAVIITDARLEEPGPRILYVNEAFTRMTGYLPEEAIGQSPRFLQGPNSDRAELDKLKQSLQQGEACEIGILNYRKNGDEFFVSMNISPVTDQQGRLTHFISIERDVTERREYLKAIESQNAKLREIAWIQSHVVRAPLARILGLINLLEGNHSQKFDQQTLYGYIKTSGVELDTIIRDIVQKAENVENEIEVNA
ncbi:two-component regulator propeller domain-containing protein [Sabulibacter ruber]|uniref:two-component regulator propeller domain-containing protein n=1 Tax=Sabulibacter ruber TaxID=2811901 RepID=UPI001A972F71|nr:two-component regulator propeller domain-containing protein [Sabulibacter ruber]